VAGLRLLGLVLFAPQSMQRLLVASAPGKGVVQRLRWGVFRGLKGSMGWGMKFGLAALFRLKV